MKKYFTLTYLVKKFYKSSVLPSDVKANDSRNEWYEEECWEFCPSDQSVNNILDFAHAYDVFPTKSAGYVERILN
ncbi:MAG: hypothetical protein PHU98_05055 [Mariniphaga sp.]|nr:hypothetical protein [Mariniphaga sp.]